MLKCKECGARLMCLATRNGDDNTVNRRYKCPVCNSRFSTREYIVYKIVDRHKEKLEPEPEPEPKREKKAKKSVKLTKSKLSKEEIRWRLQHPGQTWPGSEKDVKPSGKHDTFGI